MVVTQGARPALIGAIAGIIGVLALGQLLASGPIGSLLYGVTPYDPGTLGTVAAVLVAVALLAAWLPARRAVRVQAVDAIASE